MKVLRTTEETGEKQFNSTSQEKIVTHSKTPLVILKSRLLILTICPLYKDQLPTNNSNLSLRSSQEGSRTLMRVISHRAKMSINTFQNLHSGCRLMC